MISYNQAYYDLRTQLQPLYDEGEATTLAHEALNHITDLDKLQRITEKNTLLTVQQMEQYNIIAQKLVAGMPWQYITGVSWFMGRQFRVNDQVLIPRPETEELVDWIKQDNHIRTAISILDIGTGSGCIPISLKLEMPGTEVTTCDISSGALRVATENAQDMQAAVQFLQLDFLDEATWNELGTYDVIVSNPPYITEREKDSMHINVKNHEPSTALFVPDDDALVFYRKIADFGKEHLNAGGAIYCELNRDFAMATKEMFEIKGYSRVEVKEDMHGNLRMLKAQQ